MPWLLQLRGCMHTHESLHAPAAFGAGTATGALLLLSLFLSSQAACVCFQLCHVLLLNLSSALKLSAPAWSSAFCCCSASRSALLSAQLSCPLDAVPQLSVEGLPQVSATAGILTLYFYPSPRLADTSSADAGGSPLLCCPWCT